MSLFLQLTVRGAARSNTGEGKGAGRGGRERRKGRKGREGKGREGGWRLSFLYRDVSYATSDYCIM